MACSIVLSLKDNFLLQEGSHKSYRPVTVLTFRMNNMLFGKDPFTYHFVNVILHSLVCMLYFHATRTMCRTAVEYSISEDKRSKKFHSSKLLQDSFEQTFIKYVPIFATALFIAHPIHCEAVAGIVGRAELLSALFLLLVFIFYSQFQVLSHCCSVLFLICAAGSKEQGITITAICAVYDMFVASKLTPVELLLFRKTSNIVTGLRVCILAFVACLILLWRVQLMNGDIPVFTLFDNPASLSETPSRQLTFNFLIAQNFWLLLTPSSLLCDWSFGTVPIIFNILDVRNLASIIFYISLFLISYHAAVKKNATAKVLMMSLSFLIFPFLPASNLFFSVGFVIAERVLYVPSMGYCLLVAIGISKLYFKFHLLKKPILYAFIFLLFCFSVKTVSRNADWESDFSIFQSGLKVTKHNAKIWNNIGHTFEENEPKKALVYFQQAAKIQPDDIGSHMNVGRIKKRLELFEEAEDSYRKAKDLFPKWKKGRKNTARVAPEHLQLYVQLGNLMKLNKSRLEEVEELYKEVLSYRPDFLDAHINKGEILILLGRLDEAIKCYETALLYSNKKDDVYFNLAVVHSQNGNVSGAIEYYTYAILENPNHVKSLYNSAVILQETGNKDLIERAKIRVERVLQLEPDNHLALSLMGSIYLDKGDENTAISYWKKALQINHNDKSVLYNMAHMYLKKEEKLDDTLKIIDRLLTTYPNHIKTLMLHGEILMTKKKDFKAAGKAFKRITEIEPSHTQARHNYCVVILQEGKLQEAEKCMKDVLVSDPTAKYVSDNLDRIRKYLAKRATETKAENVEFSSHNEITAPIERESQKQKKTEEEQEEMVFGEPLRKKNTFSRRAKAILEEAKQAVNNVEKHGPKATLANLESALEKVKSSVRKLTTISKQVSSDLHEKCPSKSNDIDEIKSDQESDAVENLRRRAIKVLDDLEASLN